MKIEFAPQEAALRTPRVSIVMFCRDGARSIRRSIDSVLGQNYPDLEYVVQDGASTDGTLEILQSYGSRIKLESAPDGGTNDGFWRALQRCTGDIIGCCLADETLLPGSIDGVVQAFLEHPDAAAITGNADLIDLDGRIIGEHVDSAFDLTGYLLGDYCPNFAASFIRRQALVDVGFFNERWKDGSHDTVEFEIWCRLGSEKKVRYLPKKLAQYAIHPAQMSHRLDRIFGELDSRTMIIDRFLFGPEKFFGVDPQFRNFIIRRQHEIIVRHLTYNDLPDAAEAVAAKLKRVLPSASVQAGGLSPMVWADLVLPAGRGGKMVVALLRPLVPRVIRDLIPLSMKLAFLERLNAGFTGLRRLITWLTGKRRIPPMLPALPTDVAIGIGATGDQTANPQERKVISLEQILRGSSYLSAGRKFAERGLVDQACFMYEKAAILKNPYVDSLRVQLAMKRPDMTDAEHLKIARRWADQHARPNPGQAKFRFESPGERITIGYHCGFWQNRTAIAQAVPFIAAHDRRRFRLVGYSPGAQQSTITSLFDEFRNTAAMDDAAFVDLVRADKVDVFVEMTGFSLYHRFGAMGTRCAPVQVSYLNHTGTSGVDAVDYIIGDPIALPLKSQPYYTETIYQLPECFFCFSYDERELPPVAPLPARSNGYVTFGCFGGSDKLNRENLRIWANLLRRIPDSRLILQNGGLTPAGNRDYFARQFSQLGVEPKRITLLPGADRNELLSNYGKVDISLDTWPYNGGNTIAESVWQGVPPLTFTGDRFSCRYGASLVTACGLSDWVGNSAEEMINIAERISGDLNQLAEIRSDLRRTAVAHGLSDPPRFARQMETAYEAMIAQRT